MKYKLIITQAAQQEIEDALSYYLNVNEETAGNFIDALQDLYGRLEAHPQHYSYFGTSNKLRCVLFSRFPYLLIF